MGLRVLINNLLKRFEKDFKTLNRIEVSSSAILNNYDYFRDKTGLEIWPVLKSNAYGHGIGKVARVLREREFEYYVADSYFESLTIHEAVPGSRVLLIGYTRPSNYKNMKLDNLVFTVYDLDTVKALAALGRRIKLHVCIDTGMGRLGIKVNELADFINFINKYSKLEIEGVWSHFADADGQDSFYTTKQLEEFSRANEILQLLVPEIKYVHLANTAGTDFFKEVGKNSNSM